MLDTFVLFNQPITANNKELGNFRDFAFVDDGIIDSD